MRKHPSVDSGSLKGCRVGVSRVIYCAGVIVVAASGTLRHPLQREQTPLGERAGRDVYRYGTPAERTSFAYVANCRSSVVIRRSYPASPCSPRRFGSLRNSG